MTDIFARLRESETICKYCGSSSLWGHRNDCKVLDVFRFQTIEARIDALERALALITAKEASHGN